MFLFDFVVLLELHEAVGEKKQGQNNTKNKGFEGILSLKLRRIRLVYHRAQATSKIFKKG